VTAQGGDGIKSDTLRVELNLGTIETQLMWAPLSYDNQLEKMNNLLDTADMDMVVRTCHALGVLHSTACCLVTPACLH